MVQPSDRNIENTPVGIQTEGTNYFYTNSPDHIDEFPKWSGGHIQFVLPEHEFRALRLECLKMATLHANAELVETGAVYRIAEDYYDYIINGKKQNNGNS